jgi:ABC-type uncharacterized transport system substrate-binding protein
MKVVSSQWSVVSESVFGFVLAAVLFALCFPVHAQQQPTKIPRIGYTAGLIDSPTTPELNQRAFRQKLTELGYVEGKNIAVEIRKTGGTGSTGEAEVVRDLVRANVDLLLLSAYPSIRAAKEATKSIPIVMVTTVDPVRRGLVESLARPGGNITGVTQLARDLSGKRLELLAEMIPGLARVGFIVVKDSIDAYDTVKRYQETARALKVEQRIFEISSPAKAGAELSAILDAAAKARVGALIPIRNSTINPLVPRITDLAMQRRRLHRRRDRVLPACRSICRENLERREAR